jgi:hypothetical protein
MSNKKSYFCVFCGEEIFPEAESNSTDSSGRNLGRYVFQCENIICQAVYESVGIQIPDITVYYRPSLHDELDFEK